MRSGHITDLNRMTSGSEAPRGVKLDFAALKS
jgi:hypothetical protein